MAEYSWISWKGRAEASSAPGGDASAMLRDWLTEATASSYIDTVVATCRNICEPYPWNIRPKEIVAATDSG